MEQHDHAPSRRLDGKVAVVTGSTQGLGEAIARRFAAEGATGLVVTGRNRDRGGTVARSLKDQGCRAVFVPADLTRVEDCRTILAAADRPFGRLIDPAEVARACVDLASAGSGLLTGANLDFDQTIMGVSDQPLPVPA